MSRLHRHRYCASTTSLTAVTVTVTCCTFPSFKFSPSEKFGLGSPLATLLVYLLPKQTCIHISHLKLQQTTQSPISKHPLPPILGQPRSPKTELRKINTVSYRNIPGFNRPSTPSHQEHKYIAYLGISQFLTAAQFHVSDAAAASRVPIYHSGGLDLRVLPRSVFHGGCGRPPGWE